MAEDPDIRAMNSKVDATLQRCLESLPYLELVYLTDAGGRQVSSNVLRQKGAIACDSDSRGRNWAQKEWFKAVKEKGEPFISQIYRSEATNTFCLTISVPVRREGITIGVLGADINFEDLLHI